MEKNKKPFFSHDLHARNSRDLTLLIKDYRSSGLGIYWSIVELIHEEGGSVINDEATWFAMAKSINEEYELIRRVVLDCVQKYKLFFIEEELIFSNRARRNLSWYDDIKNKRAEAGRRSAEKRALQNSTSVQQVFNTSSTSVEQIPTKERKGTELKGTERKGKKEREIADAKNPDPKKSNVKTELDQIGHFAGGLVSYDAQADLGKDQGFLESLAMTRGVTMAQLNDWLENWHLKRQEENAYPMSLKQMKSGFTLYVKNKKNHEQKNNFKNGQANQKFKAADGETIGAKSHFDND